MHTEKDGRYDTKEKYKQTEKQEEIKGLKNKKRNRV